MNDDEVAGSRPWGPVLLALAVYAALLYSAYSPIRPALDRKSARMAEAADLHKVGAIPETVFEAHRLAAEQEAEEIVSLARYRIGWINTGSLFLLLYIFLWPHLAGALDHGATRVGESIRQAERRRDEAEAALAAAKALEARIPEDVAAIRIREAASGEAEARRLRDLAETESRQVAAHVQVAIAHELEVARKTVALRISEAAVDKAMERLANRLGEDQRRLLATRMVERLADLAPSQGRPS